MEAKLLANTIGKIVFTKKGYDVKIFDLRKLTAFADFFVICSADSDTQVKSIADEIDHEMSKQGIKCKHIEGYNALEWVLLDYFDVVVHVFKQETRLHYNLEKLWGDAPVIALVDSENE